MSPQQHPSHAVHSAPLFDRELDAAVKLARESGEIVRAFYEVPPTVRWKDPTEPVTEADRAVNSHLVKRFRQLFPEDGILAEESRDDLSRLQKRRVWIADPLDGTAEFISHNGEFCIMIGLALDGEPVVGVVYQPVDDVLFAAARGAGAYMETETERFPLQVSDAADIPGYRLVVSRSHRVPLLARIIAKAGVRRERSLGSVGLKIGLIARSQAEFYVHPNAGTREWDTCAPEIILRESGGEMTDCWNRRLSYNKQDVVRHFGLLASNGVSHSELCSVVGEVLDEAGIDPEFGF